jgi:hypothetical protein
MHVVTRHLHTVVVMLLLLLHLGLYFHFHSFALYLFNDHKLGTFVWPYVGSPYKTGKDSKRGKKKKPRVTLSAVAMSLSRCSFEPT